MNVRSYTHKDSTTGLPKYELNKDTRHAEVGSGKPSILHKDLQNAENRRNCLSNTKWPDLKIYINEHTPIYSSFKENKISWIKHNRGDERALQQKL